MAWNLNNKGNDYKLYAKLTDELIQITGLAVIIIKTTQENVDNIFNEAGHISASEDSIFKDIMLRPENPALFEDDDILNKFGFMSMSNINLFISSAEALKIVDNIEDIVKMVGSIILLPSGKYLEITNVKVQVPGVNNMFLYANQKNVFMFICKPYSFNHDDVGVLQELSQSVPGGQFAGSTSVPDLSDIFNMDVNEVASQAVVDESTLGSDYDPVFGDFLIDRE